MTHCNRHDHNTYFASVMGLKHLPIHALTSGPMRSSSIATSSQQYVRELVGVGVDMTHRNRHDPNTYLASVNGLTPLPINVFTSDPVWSSSVATHSQPCRVAQQLCVRCSS